MDRGIESRFHILRSLTKKYKKLKSGWPGVVIEKRKYHNTFKRTYESIVEVNVHGTSVWKKPYVYILKT